MGSFGDTFCKFEADYSAIITAIIWIFFNISLVMVEERKKGILF